MFRHVIGGVLVLSLLFSPPAPAEYARKKAAEDVVQAIRPEQTLRVLLEDSLASGLGDIPVVKFALPLLAEFFSDNAMWRLLHKELVKTYADEFSEEELTELAAFLNSPTGRKFIERSPKLFIRASGKSARKVSKHSGRLQKALKERVSGLITADTP